MCNMSNIVEGFFLRFYFTQTPSNAASETVIKKKNRSFCAWLHATYVQKHMNCFETFSFRFQMTCKNSIIDYKICFIFVSQSILVRLFVKCLMPSNVNNNSFKFNQTAKSENKEYQRRKKLKKENLLKNYKHKTNEDFGKVHYVNILHF